jgi:hypothetical protein
LFDRQLEISITQGSIEDEEIAGIRQKTHRKKAGGEPNREPLAKLSGPSTAASSFLNAQGYLAR